MTIFTKNPASPEAVAQLKKEGKTLIQVTCTRLYLIDEPLPPAEVERIAAEWFVKFRGSAHAWRDGSHIGGSDTVSEVKVLTQEGRVIAIKNETTP